jgi:hypothetical protein
MLMSDLAGRKVKTIDNALSVFCDRDVNSASRQLEAGAEIQLGGVSEFEGREWVEAILLDATVGFVLGASVRSHTDILADVHRTVQPLVPSPSWVEAPPPYVWGVIVGVISGIAAALYIPWAIVGDSVAVRAAFGQSLPPWPLKVLLGVLCAVACVGILRRRRVGVVAFWVAGVINILFLLFLGVSGRLDPGMISQVLTNCVGVGVNVVYFAKRWRFMEA